MVGDRLSNIKIIEQIDEKDEKDERSVEAQSSKPVINHTPQPLKLENPKAQPAKKCCR